MPGGSMLPPYGDQEEIERPEGWGVRRGQAPALRGEGGMNSSPTKGAVRMGDTECRMHNAKCRMGDLGRAKRDRGICSGPLLCRVCN